ncbi:uncharacterized protein IUM83_13262 [Phytophthora cinnamomi]|uniref:uncharacterized protein n=1 Tax=Phytophthora cinnamomi TaxID=4785 RepID=UPI003559E495|nr:hypothetical protein IUM83_13262 [Phytophthora cinnamomi]
MWKSLTCKYREVYAMFTKSGNHKPFAAFHGGRMDVYYLHLLTTISRPNLHKCIIHMLPASIAADSMEIASTSQTMIAKPPQERMGKRGNGVVDGLMELLFNEERTFLTKRQIAFFDESMTLKRQKDARSETEHAVTMRAAAIREKKEGIELLVSLQRSLAEMRRRLSELTEAGRLHDDVEVVELRCCIAKLRNEMEACL